MKIEDTIYFKFKEANLASFKLVRECKRLLENNLLAKIFVIVWLICLELILIFVK